RDGVQIFLDTAELVQEHGFEQGGLAREMGVDGLLAHPQSLGEVVHRDAAKAVGQEVLARGPDDPLPGGPVRGYFGCCCLLAPHDCSRCHDTEETTTVL